MLQTHPLAWIPAGARRGVFLSLLVVTLLMMVIFAVTGAALTTAAAPQGIVSFELAGTTTKADQILASWDSDARLRASFGLGFDYLFMPTYSTTIGLGCVWAADILRRLRWPMWRLGMALAWAIWFAALCDAVENVALTTMLWRGVAAPWPFVSTVCASVKFTLIVLGLAYVLYGACAALRQHLAPQ